MTLEEVITQRIETASTLEDLAKGLEQLLNGGFAISHGRLIVIRQLVDQLNGLRIEIFHREHPPPHFHVRAPGMNATFTILDCQLLNGDLRRQDLALIQWWHHTARAKLVDLWNATRPSDCPVGPIALE